MLLLAGDLDVGSDSTAFVHGVRVLWQNMREPSQIHQGLDAGAPARKAGVEARSAYTSGAGDPGVFTRAAGISCRLIPDESSRTAQRTRTRAGIPSAVSSLRVARRPSAQSTASGPLTQAAPFQPSTIILPPRRRRMRKAWPSE